MFAMYQVDDTSNFHADMRHILSSVLPFQSEIRNRVSQARLQDAPSQKVYKLQKQTCAPLVISIQQFQMQIIK